MEEIATRTDAMAAALDEARAAAARGEVPVGAVIVRGGQILARAGNRTLELKDPTAHAEILAIRAAAQALGSERLVGCDLYVTLEPCAMCAAAISFARLRRLYWGRRTPRAGQSSTGRASSRSRPAIMRRNPTETSAKARPRPCCAAFFAERR